MSLLRELSRRNVVKVAGIYVVVAWLLLQVTDVLSGMLPVPSWTGSLVFLLLLVGFPVILVFSWIFEITPEGLRRDTGESEGSVETASRRLDGLIIVLLTAVLIALAADRLLPSDTPADGAIAETSGDPASAQAQSSEGPRTIAVLPFLNMSRDPNEEYFTDGVSVQILNTLSDISGLKVISQRSSFAFKDQNKSIQEIADLLETRYVIDGSVFRDGNRLRITAQLVDAAEDTNVWTEVYDEQAEDLFSIQDDIARSVVQRLELEGFTLAPEDASVPSLDAYELYLLAQQELFRGGYTTAAAKLDSVLQQEPNFVEALAMRASAELMRSDVFFGSKEISVSEARPLADEWLEKAEGIDPNSPDVLAVRGLYHQVGLGLGEPTTLEDAENYYRRSLEQRPNSTWVRRFHAMIFGQTGRPRDAVEQLKIAASFDPANSAVLRDLFNWSIMLHDLDYAEATLDRWKRIDPDGFAQKLNRARYLRFAGQLADSLLYIRELENDQDFTDARREDLFEPKGEALLALGEFERAMNLEGPNPKYKIRSLTLQGRHGEAILAAKRWVEQEPDIVWPVDELLRALFFGNRWDEFVELLEENIERLYVFREYEYFWINTMAYGPYVSVGHEGSDKIAETLEDVRLGARANSEPAKPEADLMYARASVLLGMYDQAVESLEVTQEKYLYTPRIPIDPVFARLSDREDYQALIDRLEEKINSERDKLDLKPIKLVRRSSTS